MKPIFYGTPDQRKPLFYEQNNFNGTLFSANSPLMNGNPSNAIYGPVPTEPKPLISEQILIFLRKNDLKAAKNNKLPNKLECFE